MGDDASPVSGPPPAVTMSRQAGAQLALALTVLALVMASNSIMNESWLTQSSEFGDAEMTVSQGLTEVSMEMCSGDACESQIEEMNLAYDNCSKAYGELPEKEFEEACGDLRDSHNAGFVGMIILITASVVLLLGSVLQAKAMIGSSPRAGLVSGAGGLLVGLAVLIWFLMLPESDNDPDWGSGLLMALGAAAMALIAGFSGTMQSLIDGPERMRARGVRAGLEMDEFVLKESSCGDHTLSILADDDLVRVVKVNRIGASASVNDILATRRDSYTGFSHQRLDWLDEFKGLWWVVLGASLISAIMIDELFLIPMILAGLLALLQLMDPERFVVSTNSGDHPFYINRWRSNRELTNLAMDLVDDAMIAVLRGDDLDTTVLDARAEMIAERFSIERDARQKEIEEGAKPPAPAVVVMEQAPPGPVVEQAPEVPPAPEAQPAPEAPVAIPAPPAVEEAPQPWPEPEPETQQEAEPEPQPEPEPPAPEPASTPAPATEPAPVPAVTIPPPPPLPAVIPAPPVIPDPPAPAPIPTPPVMPAPPPPAPMPPPPGIGGMPTPPPPMGAAPMAHIQETFVPPPPVMVQAAPREENLTDDEKDDLLGALGD